MTYYEKLMRQLEIRNDCEDSKQKQHNCIIRFETRIKTSDDGYLVIISIPSLDKKCSYAGNQGFCTRQAAFVRYLSKTNELNYRYEENCYVRINASLLRIANQQHLYNDAYHFLINPDNLAFELESKFYNSEFYKEFANWMVKNYEKKK